MPVTIDVDAILTPMPGDNPSGEDLRYSPLYEEIKEARRADDPFDRGDWQREVKKSEWDKVIQASVVALTQKSKDLQIAAWLTEGLIQKSGFGGLLSGLQIINGFLTRFWDTVYPRIEEDDLEYRAAPLEFLNEKIWMTVKEAPVTDPAATAGHSWFKWKESREVGYEADIRNRYGDVDEAKRKARDERVAEGKLAAEDFDAAVSQSSVTFYRAVAGELTQCREEFQKLDATVDEKFGKAAPRLAELKAAIEECEQLVFKFLKDKGGAEPIPEHKTEADSSHRESKAATVHEASTAETETSVPSPRISMSSAPVMAYSESADGERMLWESAVLTLSSSGIKTALGQLLSASCSAPSVREKNRLRLLMARLCLKAERPDLARPIVEELHALIEELHLERWESPVWIAEVLDTLYQCLTRGEPSEEDIGRARGLFQKLCTTDVTKAITYKL